MEHLDADETRWAAPVLLWAAHIMEWHGIDDIVLSERAARTLALGLAACVVAATGQAPAWARCFGAEGDWLGNLGETLDVHILHDPDMAAIFAHARAYAQRHGHAAPAHTLEEWAPPEEASV